MLGPFWGPFLSKKSVVCRSKMSLTYGPLKIVILAPSGHPKSTKFEVIFWCKFDRFGRWLGQAVHKHQCFFSSVVHVILAAEQSKAECSRRSTAEHNTADQNSAHYSYSIAQHYSTLLVQHSTAQQSTAQHSKAEQSTAEHKRAQKSTAQHSRAQHNRAEQRRAEQSRVQQTTAEHSRAE